MYPWDSDSQGDYPPEPLRSWKAPAPVETSPAHPVQVALDRRDNGGDALAAASQVAPAQVAPAQVAPAQVAPAQVAPGQAATPPTPGRTRQ
jgi:hypothetical protein